jgi:hypothetical protein
MEKWNDVVLQQGRVGNHTVTRYLKTHNHDSPQCALNHQTPIQALQKWQAKRPDLFLKRGSKQTRLGW